MASIIQWDNGAVSTELRPFIYDPVVIWGDTPTSDAKLRGTIPDARISSVPAPCDTQVTDPDGKVWLCYTNNFIKGCLWLLVNSVPINANTGSMAQYRKPLDLGTPPKA